MPKKRKTRQQKARRPKQQKPSKGSVSTDAPSEQPLKPTIAKTDNPEVDELHQLRMRLMKLSLWVFGGLVLIQLALWVSLRTGLLPEDWIELLLR